MSLFADAIFDAAVDLVDAGLDGDVSVLAAASGPGSDAARAGGGAPALVAARADAVLDAASALAAAARGFSAALDDVAPGS